MAIPSQIEIRLPLLHLVHESGGQIKPGAACEALASYFALSREERQELVPSGVAKKFDSWVAWARVSLCSNGFLDRSVRGVWKITEKGRHELSRLGLMNKPFPAPKS